MRVVTALRPSFDGSVQLGFGVAACVVSLAAFFPQVIDASEASIRYHPAAHAGPFFVGTVLGLLHGSHPPGRPPPPPRHSFRPARAGGDAPGSPRGRRGAEGAVLTGGGH